LIEKNVAAIAMAGKAQAVQKILEDTNYGLYDTKNVEVSDRGTIKTAIPHSLPINAKNATIVNPLADFMEVTNPQHMDKRHIPDKSKRRVLSVGAKNGNSVDHGVRDKGGSGEKCVR
jgi:hypothetical protein